MKIRFALAAFLALGALLVAAPASANPPVHRVSTTSGVEEPMNCGDGVVLTETFEFTSRRVTFFDDAGRRTKFVDQGYYDGVITNEATGTRFRDRNHYALIVDFVARTVTYNGAMIQIHELGGGPVLLLDVGHIVYSLDTREVLEMSAKRPLFSAGLGNWDYEAFYCAALASR